MSLLSMLPRQAEAEIRIEYERADAKGTIAVGSVALAEELLKSARDALLNQLTLAALTCGVNVYGTQNDDDIDLQTGVQPPHWPLNVRPRTDVASLVLLDRSEPRTQLYVSLPRLGVDYVGHEGNRLRATEWMVADAIDALHTVIDHTAKLFHGWRGAYRSVPVVVKRSVMSKYGRLTAETRALVPPQVSATQVT